jgi:hypothetical protein
MVIGAVVLGFAAPVAAQQSASIRFDYQRKDGASSCPDATVIASSVAERLGYEPFDAAAADTMKVTVLRKEHGLQAKIEWVGSDGKPKAERVLSSRRSDCGDLSATMALAIAIAIDPFRAGDRRTTDDAGPPPPAAGPTATKERETVPSLVVAAPPGPPAAPMTARAAVGLVGGIGSAPVRTLGAIVRVGARRRDLSLDVEGRADLPASVPLQVGEVRTSLLVASLVPCVHWRIVAGCGLVTGGALRAAGHGLVDSRQVIEPYFALGARFALELRMADKLYLTVHGDAFAPLITTELRVGGEEFWTTPPLSFLAGVGLAAVFP